MVQFNVDGSNQSQDSSPFIGNSDEPWSEKWKEMLKHLLSIKDLFSQLQYITNGILPAMQGFTEGQMGGEADIMNKLSRLLKDENDIQAAFNSFQSCGNNGQWVNKVAAGIKAANDILNILRTDPAFKNDKDLLNSVETQIGQIFGVDVSGGKTIPTDQNNINKIGAQWSAAWDDADPNKTKSPSNAALTAYNQSFTALSTDFNSQSSIAQSKFKYLQANEQQYLGIEQSMASNFIKLEEAANNGIAK